MQKIWLLYMVITSNVTEVPLHVERLAAFPAHADCTTARRQLERHKNDSESAAYAKIYGRNTRRSFDCFSILIGTEPGASGTKPGAEYGA